ncbi:F-box protein-like [Iris pallida]|uniref:F-box protein-like n=1 Tax=Iris pallida TaxID=29817 RepID=A0AAX6H203_IRIPA|nr:F-box protein-like [Iris pallida]
MPRNERRQLLLQQRQNSYYDEIEAQLYAASNPTRLDLVAKLKPEAKAPVVVDFPVDDVVVLILRRLTAKTLQKFRCVCKSWNSLIQQDHHFISLHPTAPQRRQQRQEETASPCNNFV